MPATYVTPGVYVEEVDRGSKPIEAAGASMAAFVGITAEASYKTIDPETGNYYDDTKRYIEASKLLSSNDRFQIYEGNARRVFPRLDAALKAKGK